MNLKALLISCGLSILLVATGGCVVVAVGAAVGATGYAYVRGELKGTESASLEKTWAAAQAAVKELEFHSVNLRKDAVEAELEARTAKDTHVKIQLRRVSDASTEVRIRVGMFGDQGISQTIRDKIKSKL